MDGTRLGRIVFAAAAAALGTAAPGGTSGAGSTGPQSAAGYPPAPRSGLRGKIAFNGFRGGIWVMNADGSGRRKITNPRLAPEGATDYDPSWSPDGKRIVFRTDRGHYVRDESGSGAQGIFVVDVRTRRERQIQPRTGGLFPAWSPNGKWIAMTVLAPGGGESIDVKRPDGTLVRTIRLRTFAGECSTWSPDSTRIAFCGHSGDGNWAVWVMNADGTDQRQLTHPELVQPAGTGGDYPGAWSPDGKRIAYSSGQHESREVWVIDADGTSPRRLTRWPGADGPVVWLPDGRIVFDHEPAGGSGPKRWYLMNADGTGIRSLPQLNGVGELDWLWRVRSR